MLVPALLFSLASLAQHSAALRSGCSANETVLAILPGDTPVELRFSVSDGSDCYKVSAVIDGKRIEGYLPASALKGTDQFERERRSARESNLTVLYPSPASTSKLPGSDPGALYRAGLAAYKNDQVRSALDYWKQSLELQPNEDVARLYHKVEREAANDHSAETLFGMRVSLRYEGETLPPDSARAMIAVLDAELTRLSNLLGCTGQERITAIVQSRQAYLKTTDAAEWSAAQFDGRIRVALPGADRRVLAHEMAHACLANISPNWPAWLHEGIAQKLSGDTLSAAEREQVRRMAASHSIPRLENMGQSWSRMNAQHARVAYNVALAAADLLFAEYGDIRNVLASPERLPQITTDLDRQLGL